MEHDRLLSTHLQKQLLSIDGHRFFWTNEHLKTNKTMDERNGSFREMRKKIIVFKKRTILNSSNDLDRSWAFWLVFYWTNNISVYELNFLY